MVAGVFDGARARAAAAPVHRSASTTTSPARACPTTRRWTSSRPTRSARSSSASARTARSARTRTRSRSSAPRRTCTPRATSSTTRRSRARRPCRTCASGRSRSGRRTSCSSASFVGCHHFGLLDQVDVLGRAAPGATLLLNCRHAAGRGLGCAAAARSRSRSSPSASRSTRSTPARIAREVGLAGRINTVLQTCFFAISGVLPRDEAIAEIKEAIAKTYGRRGAEVVERNHAAVDRALEGLHRIEVPDRVTGHARAAADGARARAGVRPHRHRGDDGRPRRRPAGQRAAGGRHLPERHDGVREAQHLRAGRGLGPGPVHPVRQLQLRLPAQRDPLHATTTPSQLEGAPEGFRSAPLDAPGLPDTRYTLQVYVEDCTGCGLCVEACPVGGAGRPGPQGDQPRAARAAGGRRAREHRVLRDAAGERPVPGGLRHGARHPVPASRCSSSPAPARAAARRPTSSCSRSCSATG